MLNHPWLLTGLLAFTVATAVIELLLRRVLFVSIVFRDRWKHFDLSYFLQLQLHALLLLGLLRSLGGRCITHEQLLCRAHLLFCPTPLSIAAACMAMIAECALVGYRSKAPWLVQALV